ncbi:MAG: hypothetical protein FWE21_04730 [Defluviitaleaceae bacterium]|nr:hypothetical protein [Defluviitaleaceae bacterium]
MELISSQIDRIEDLLSEMDGVIDGARAVPFSGKISLEKESLFHLIDDVRGIVHEMRKGLPAEINQARRLLNDKDNQLSEARTKAEMMLRAAEAQAAQMVDEHDLTMQARETSDRILEEAKQEARNFKVSAAQYVDSIFGELDEKLQSALDAQMQKSSDMEKFYNTLLDELHHNRQSIPMDQ